MLTLAVKKRNRVGKASKRREGGNIPAVFYGPKEKSTPILLSEKDFLRVWREAGESAVVELCGVGESKEVLIHDVDIDPLSGNVRHADFYVIEKGKKITVGVPLVFEGEAPAVKELGGVLVKVLHEFSIEVMPKDLPHEIVIDVSGIKDFDTQIKVGDVAVPAGVLVLTDVDEVVALVSEAKEEEIEETPDLDSIEVEQKGKEEEAGGEGGGDTSEEKGEGTK